MTSHPHGRRDLDDVCDTCGGVGCPVCDGYGDWPCAPHSPAAGSR